MSYLIEILLPVTGDLGRETLETVKSDLTHRFGGVTLHANIPAEGLWKDDQEIEVFVRIPTRSVPRENQHNINKIRNIDKRTASRSFSRSVGPERVLKNRA